MPGPEIPRLVDDLFRRQSARMIAGLVRIFGPGQLELVEDVVQDAMVRAMRVWPFEGVPDNPEAWLTRVARNLATDAVRRRRMARRKEDELRQWAESTAPESRRLAPDEVADDTLRMIFTCCHPSMPPETRVALTLKTLCGFSVGEIASALLAKPGTVAQRLARAKSQLRENQEPFAVPPPAELAGRLDSVLEVLYLTFNEGYRAHRGDELVRIDLVGEAIRLGRLLLQIPETRAPKVHALLALMFFGAARLPARTGPVGELLTLARQDRCQWDRDSTRLGFHHFARSIGGDELTPYHVEAAIASCHAAAPTYADTDWRTILRHYDHLLQLVDTPIVRLNRAVAVAKVHGPRAALAALAPLAEARSLRAYFLLPATRAQLLWSAGDRRAAAAAFREALGLDCSLPEREFLAARLAACEAGEAAPAF